MTVTFVVFPISFIEIAGLVRHFTFALFHALGPLTLVDGAIFVSQLSVTVTHANNPFAFILDALFLVDIDTLSMSQTVHDLTLIG